MLLCTPTLKPVELGSEGERDCPRSHSQEVVELGWNPGSHLPPTCPSVRSVTDGGPGAMEMNETHLPFLRNPAGEMGQ